MSDNLRPRPQRHITASAPQERCCSALRSSASRSGGTPCCVWPNDCSQLSMAKLRENRRAMSRPPNFSTASITNRFWPEASRSCATATESSCARLPQSPRDKSWCLNLLTARPTLGVAGARDRKPGEKQNRGQPNKELCSKTPLKPPQVLSHLWKRQLVPEAFSFSTKTASTS